MKGSMNQQNQQQGKQDINQKSSGQDIRSNLDSRKNLEQDFKGSDVTHNKKDVRSEQKSRK